MAPTSISRAEARWLALEAQGLDRPRPKRRPGLAQLAGLVGELGTVQIDAVNVLARTQFIVPFSRLGSYDPDLLLAATGPGGSLFEYWGHATSLLPLELQPLLRWRMAERRDLTHGGPKVRAAWKAWRETYADYIDRVMAEVRDNGPLRASQLADPRRRQGEWWERRSAGRQALEWLSGAGLLTVWRTASFEAVYDLPERVFPSAILARPTPSVAEAQYRLGEISLRALGVATAADVAAYFGIGVATAMAVLREMADSGAAQTVDVEGWREPGYRVPGARPRRPSRSTATLISPFDSLIWDRRRTERLFGMSYVVEIYVPAQRRSHGYYVLPVLLGDRLVARLDLKADRQAPALRVQAAHLEAGEDPTETAGPIAGELRAMASWLGLESVGVSPRGDLSVALEAAL